MPAINDVYQVTARGRCIDQTIMLTHHYNLMTWAPGATDADVRDALVDAMRGDAGGDDEWESFYLNCMPQNYTLQEWIVQKIFSTRLAYTVYTRGVPGTVANDAEASNLAAVCTLRTDTAGRSQVSNKHIGPIPNAAAVFTAGSITPAYKVALGGIVAGMLENPTPVGGLFEFQPVIYHRAPVPGFSVLTTGNVQDTVRVMRRRTVGLGI